MNDEEYMRFIWIGQTINQEDIETWYYSTITKFDIKEPFFNEEGIYNWDETIQAYRFQPHDGNSEDEPVNRERIENSYNAILKKFNGKDTWFSREGLYRWDEPSKIYRLHPHDNK